MADKDVAELIRKAAEEARMASGSMFPKEYSEETGESSYKFLTECCWTYNEADGSTERIPEMDYIRYVCDQWWESRNNGQVLIIEKSRRLVMSWVLRGLELQLMGTRRTKGVVAGLNYPKAAEHVWRIWWLYEKMRYYRPEFRLKKCDTRGGNTASYMLDLVILPNGSTVSKLNQEGESFQGAGFGFVTMEEFSLFQNPDYMLGQSLFVTQGKAGGYGGQVSIITNASPNPQWREIKA